MQTDPASNGKHATPVLGFSRPAVVLWLSVGFLLAAVCTGTFFVLRAYDRHRANLVLADARIVDGAIDQWCIENGKKGSDVLTRDIVKHYLKPGSRLYRNEGRDILGHPFVLGPNDDGASLHPHTVARLAWALDPAIPMGRRYNFGPTHTPDIVRAALLDDVDLFRELVRKGADVQQPDAEGRTPLYWAAQTGHLEIVRLIWPLLPDVRAAVNSGGPNVPFNTPWWAACSSNLEIAAFFIAQNSQPAPRLLPFIVQRRPDILKALLAHGLPPNATDENGEPLLFPAVVDVDTTRLLIVAGADVNARNKWGATVLQTAIKYQQQSTAALLRVAGARE